MDWDNKEICGFAIFLRINHYKFADLRFADWHSRGTPQKFADLQVRNEPKNV
jgi:hypothetical protein